jgi:AraC-like DNA-binding protein
MVDNELIRNSPEDLSRSCGCSPRHFSRLFCAHFGVSFRAKQTEMRLHKASQILLESDAKVINVAMDSGYRHLGLFNAMFKRRFGMTPTEYRRQNHKKTKRPAARSRPVARTSRR